MCLAETIFRQRHHTPFSTNGIQYNLCVRGISVGGPHLHTNPSPTEGHTGDGIALVKKETFKRQQMQSARARKFYREKCAVPSISTIHYESSCKFK